MRGRFAPDGRPKTEDRIKDQSGAQAYSVPGRRSSVTSAASNSRCNFGAISVERMDFVDSMDDLELTPSRGWTEFSPIIRTYIPPRQFEVRRHFLDIALFSMCKAIIVEGFWGKSSESSRLSGFNSINFECSFGGDQFQSTGACWRKVNNRTAPKQRYSVCNLSNLASEK